MANQEATRRIVLYIIVWSDRADGDLLTLLQGFLCSEACHGNAISYQAPVPPFLALPRGRVYSASSPNDNSYSQSLIACIYAAPCLLINIFQTLARQRPIGVEQPSLRVKALVRGVLENVLDVLCVGPKRDEALRLVPRGGEVDVYPRPREVFTWWARAMRVRQIYQFGGAEDITPAQLSLERTDGDELPVNDELLSQRGRRAERRVDIRRDARHVVPL